MRNGRAPRARSMQEEKLSLNRLQRFGATQIETRPVLYIVLNALRISLELAACVLYFVAIEDAPQLSLADERKVGITFFPIRGGYIDTFAVLGVLFCFFFLLDFMASDNRMGYIISFDTLIFLVTAIPMVGMLIYDQVRTTTLHEVAATFWCPVFLRSWASRRFLSNIIRSVDFSSAVKEIIVEGFLLLVIVINSTGFYQATERLDSNHRMSFESTFYFIVVTITTMGYGEKDLIPQSRYTEIVCVVVIFVAMIYLPVMINKFQELTAYLNARNQYGKSLPHVVFVGTFSFGEVKLLFAEFMSGPRKFTPLNLVMVSPVPFEPKIVSLVTQPAIKARVTLCISNGSVATDELERFRTRKASALFITSSRNAIGQRGDYDAMMKSIAFHRHDRDLPQYLTLKRAMHSTVAQRTSFVYVEREKIKFTLMGMALHLPGIIPLLLNLIKTFEQFHASGIQWFDQYQLGMQNSVFSVECPPSLEGRPFRSVALIMLLRIELTTLGIVPAGENQAFQVNPDEYRMKQGDQLVVLSRGRNIYARFEEELGDTYSTSSGSEPFTEAMEAAHLRRRNKKKKKSNPLAPTMGRGFSETYYGSAEMEAAKLISTAKTSMKGPKNAYPFTDHVVLIDLSCFHLTPSLCKEEEINAMEFQQLDLMNLLQPFFETPAQSIVYVSRQDLGDYFEEHWPSFLKPIYHIRGSGTELVTLDKCNVQAAKAVIIFTSLEGDSVGGDEVLMLVQRMVHQKLQEVGREKIVPVLVELDDYEGLSNCQPRYSSEVAAEVYGSNQEDYFLTPAFIVGRTISSAMLDTVVYQAYYNPVIPQVVESLLHNPDQAHSVVSFPVIELLPEISLPGTEILYHELFRSLTVTRRLPLGLYRVIDTKDMGEELVGYRYFYTNPKPETVVKDTDFVYLIQFKET